MQSPARKHYQKAMAAKQSGGTEPGQPQTGDQYELMSAALWEARRTLKDIKSIQAKIEKKRELLPDFESYIQGVLEADQGAQDDVVMTALVWYFDIGDLEKALEIAAYALKHNLETPDRYERDTASIVAEQAAEEALQLLEQDAANAEALVPLLLQAGELTANADMHDQIRAKLHKATGYALRDAGQLQDSLDHLKRALQLNDRVGVKKDIEKLERDIKNAGNQANA